MCSHLTNVIKSSITIFAINTTTFSKTQDQDCVKYEACLYNDNTCPHLANVIKSVKTIVVVAMTTFSNNQDTVFREIVSLVK